MIHWGPSWRLSRAFTIRRSAPAKSHKAWASYTWPGHSYAELVQETRCRASALPLLSTIELIVLDQARRMEKGSAHPVVHIQIRRQKQFPPLRPRGQLWITGPQMCLPPQDDEMGRVLPTRLADDHGPEWRHIRPRLVGPGGAGGGPWTGITSAGSVSGLELRRACFFLFSGCPISPLGICSLHLERLGN